MAAAGPKPVERVSSSSPSYSEHPEPNASQVNRLQTRPSRSVEAPAFSGPGTLNKVPRLRRSAGKVSDKSPPPCFEALYRARKCKKETPRLYSLKWQCPPKFALNPEWLVVNGEDSQEVGVQDRRLIGVLETIYPRVPSIPPDPSVSPDAQCTCLDDADIPLVPITAIEDEEDFSDSLLDQHIIPGDTFRCQTQPVIMLNQKLVIEKLKENAAALIKHALEPIPDVEADVSVAASAAYIAMMISSNAGSLIDCNLLIEMLANPRMMENMTAEFGSRKHESQAATFSASSPRPPAHLDPSELSSTVHSISDLCPSAPPVGCLDLSIDVGSCSSPDRTSFNFNRIRTKFAEKFCLKKEVDYCRNLIRQHGGEDVFHCRRSLVWQHGGEKSETDISSLHLADHFDYRRKVEKMNPATDAGNEYSRKRDSKRKSCTPCMYFNSGRGCRNGADCLFQHGVPLVLQCVGKKIKADGRTSERR